MIDPLEKLNLKLDSSLRLAFELTKLGHHVDVAMITDLSWSSHNSCGNVLAMTLEFASQDVGKPHFSKPRLMALDRYNSIHMRKEPPFDIAYIAATWILSTVEKKVLIVNSPKALREINEKVSVLRFPAHSVKSLLTANFESALKFIIQECHGEAILKPLHLFGGQGILKISLHEIGEKLVSELLEKNLGQDKPHVLIQEFRKEIYAGEVRVFTLDGLALSWCLKVPAPGQFLANTRLGATLKEYTPSAKLKHSIETVAQELKKEGVFFAGFDVIGELISEINITSPRLLQAPADTQNYYEAIGQWLVSST